MKKYLFLALLIVIAAGAAVLLNVMPEPGAVLAIVPLVKLRKKKAKLAEEARSLLEGVEEGEDLDEEGEKRWNEIMGEIESLDAQIEKREKLDAIDEKLEKRDGARTMEEGEPTEEEKPAESRAASAGDDRKRAAELAHNTLRMLQGVTTRNHTMIVEAQRELARAGHYGEEIQQRAAGDYYSTLVDADGAILLPTQVVQEIEEIGEVLGVAEQIVTTYNHVVGTLKVPGATGNLRASAVAEGAAISSSMRAFQAISLNPKKWAIIVPWTYEANREAGPQILADAQRAIARGFGYAKDDALFNGDGTSTYNSIDGILSSNRSSVAEYVLPSGSTSFDDLSADDVFLMRRKIPAALRKMASYAFHPDIETTLRTLKDGNGRYIFAYNEDRGVATLGGRPVHFTEVLPDIGDDGTSTTFGVYGYFPCFKMANGQGMTSEDLREGTVSDADTGSDINLATQDLRALKVRQLFDMDCNFEEAFTKVTTAGS